MEKRETFEHFYKENYDNMYFFALRYINDEESACDIVSNGFEFAWNSFKLKEVDNWKNYLLSYIHNKCVDYIRHNQVHNRFVAQRLQMDKDVDVAEFLKRDERIDILRRHIRELPPKTQLIFRECFIEGRKYKEVGEELEITDHAVKKHVMKALNFLRDKVKNIK